MCIPNSTELPGRVFINAPAKEELKPELVKLMSFSKKEKKNNNF